MDGDLIEFRCKEVLMRVNFLLCMEIGDQMALGCRVEH
jgi:hypothetical protein